MATYQELLKTWEQFEQLIKNPIAVENNLTAALINRYSQQNIEILNDILLSSINYLHRLQKAKSLNDVICTQARLSDEIGKKVLRSSKQFLSTSLHNVSDYNEWLKANCDFATD